MAQVSLTNQVDITGQYGDSSTPISFSSNLVTTTIIQGLTVNKTADKVNWVDGPLTYTITIQNTSGGVLTDGILIDNLDTSLIDFDNTYGVLIDDVKSSDFNYNDGELKITLPQLDNEKTITIKFQVTKKS